MFSATWARCRFCRPMTPTPTKFCSRHMKRMCSEIGRTRRDRRIMSDETRNENAAGNGGFERQDLQPRGILYFLLGLAIFLLLSILGIRGVYAFLDHREKAEQPPVNPLVTNVPTDTRHIAPGYPQSVFPNPK